MDASSVLELLLNTPPGRRIGRRIEPPELSLHAPHIIDLEVAQALRRYARARLLDRARAALALQHWRELDVERYGHEPLLERIWQLRENLTAYDAAYIALAEALRAPLLTCDRALARAPDVSAQVEVITT